MLLYAAMKNAFGTLDSFPMASCYLCAKLDQTRGDWTEMRPLLRRPRFVFSNVILASVAQPSLFPLKTAIFLSLWRHVHEAGRPTIGLHTYHSAQRARTYSLNRLPLSYFYMCMLWPYVVRMGERFNNCPPVWPCPTNLPCYTYGSGPAGKWTLDFPVPDCSRMRVWSR